MKRTKQVARIRLLEHALAAACAAIIMAIPVVAGAASSTVQIFPSDVGGPIPPTVATLPGPLNHQTDSGAHYFADIEVSIPDIHMKLTTGFVPGFGPSVYAVGGFTDTWTTTSPSVAFNTTPVILSASATFGGGSSCGGGSSQCGVVSGPPLGAALGVGYVQIGVSLTGITKTNTAGSFASVGYSFQAGTGVPAYINNPHLQNLPVTFLTYQIPVMAGAAFSVDSQLTGQVCCGGEMDFSNTVSVEWIAVPEGWTISAPDGVLAGVPIYTMAAAVPEPAQWLMLLAGLVTLSGAARQWRASRGHDERPHPDCPRIV